MNPRGYSLIEVLMAAAVIGIAVTAAAAIINTLMLQEEVDSAVRRGINLQEQAVTLFREGVAPSNIIALLPESCTNSAQPSQGVFSLVFGEPQQTNFSSSAGTNDVSVDVTSCTLIMRRTVPGDIGELYLTNRLDIVRPLLR